MVFFGLRALGISSYQRQLADQSKCRCRKLATPSSVPTKYLTIRCKPCKGYNEYMRRLHRWQTTYVGARPVDEIVAEICTRVVGQRRSEQLLYA